MSWPPTLVTVSVWSQGNTFQKKQTPVNLQLAGKMLNILENRAFVE